MTYNHRRKAGQPRANTVSLTNIEKRSDREQSRTTDSVPDAGCVTQLTRASLKSGGYVALPWDEPEGEGGYATQRRSDAAHLSSLLWLSRVTVRAD